MKYFLPATRGNYRLKIILGCLCGLALVTAFWITVPTLTAANKAGKTPAELIQTNLPAGKTIVDASDSQLLEAVCKSVKQDPGEMGLIARTAGGPRKDLRGRIICTAVKCGGKLADEKAPDCTWVVDIVHEWSKSDPGTANQLAESVGNCSPECRDMLLSPGEGPGSFGDPPANINGPPGTNGGGGAAGNVCQVCHNGQNVQVACTTLDAYLASHPGDTSGACPATPSQNP